MNTAKTPFRCFEATLTSFCVALEAQHDLGSSVPTGCHVFGHESNVGLCIVAESARQTKVADFEFTVRVNEQVARLKIAMEDIGGMDIFESTADLVNEVLEVGVCQRLL